MLSFSALFFSFIEYIKWNSVFFNVIDGLYKFIVDFDEKRRFPNLMCNFGLISMKISQYIQHFFVRIERLTYNFFYKQLQFSRIGPIFGKKLSNFFEGFWGSNKRQRISTMIRTKYAKNKQLFGPILKKVAYKKKCM